MVQAGGEWAVLYVVQAGDEGAEAELVVDEKHHLLRYISKVTTIYHPHTPPQHTHKHTE